MTLVDKILLWVMTIEFTLILLMILLLYIDTRRQRKCGSKVKYPSYDTTITFGRDKDKS